MCRLTVDGEINHAVDKIRLEENRRYQEMMQTDGYVTAAKLKDAYLGYRRQAGNLVETV